MWLLALLIILFVLFVYFKLYLPLQYWKNRDVPHLSPSLIFGNLRPVVFKQKNYNECLRETCDKFEGHRYFGFYQFSKPSLVILDTELLKDIFIKHFDHFTDHTDNLPKHNDTLWQKGLFSRDGNDWHQMRTTLSPTFTSKKMKAMFHLMVDCSERFVNHYVEKKKEITVEIMQDFHKYTNDVIASCTFGIDCDSVKNQNNEFYLMGNEAFNFNGIRSLKFFGNAISPTLAKLFGVKMFSTKVNDFFLRVTKETIAYRKSTGLYRPDVIHLLMEAQKGKLTYDEDDDAVASGFAGIDESYSINKKSLNKIPITDEDIASQALIFFFGSYDTVSLMLSQTVYELVANMDVQEKLIQEVDSTLNHCNGKITYEALFGMKYLDMVISETLRIWPPAIHNRKCVKPFLIEPTLPHEKKYIVEPGTEVIVAVYSTHRNPKYFQNPDKFDPERFNNENKKNIKPLTYFPFGIGPRHCIGNRFGLMMMKIVLVNLLTHFYLVPDKKTVIPFEQRKGPILLQSVHGYWFKLKPRKDKLV